MTMFRLMLAAAVMAGSAQALSAQPAPTSPTSPPSSTPWTVPAQDRSAAQPGMETPAQRKMAIARKKITRDPKHFHGYN